MCLGGGGNAEVSVPKAPELPPAIPAPMAPKQVAQAKPLQKAGEVPDIRIGAAKKQNTTARRSGTTTSPGKQSLSIGNNQGLNV